MRYPFRHLFAFLTVALLWSCSSAQVLTTSDKEVTSFVNPFVGTGGHGHTYPGATVPFGMVQLSPDTRLDGWDGCGGYHYSDSVVYGFSHTHLQGTGVSDYGDVLFMPTNGKTTPADHWRDSYKSKFSHLREKAAPGYYETHLDNYNIDVKLTATDRVGIHQYTMAAGDTCRLFIDMMHRDELKYYDIQTIGDTVVYGYRVSKAWATDQHAYFYAVFSQPFTEFTQLMQRYDEVDEKGERTILYEEVQVFAMLFAPQDLSQPNTITVKVGWSGCDTYGAQQNLYAEALHWDFEKYKEDAKSKWEKELAAFPLPSGSLNEKQKYYTSLYHCYTTPNMWSDVDGRYRGMDNVIHEDKAHQHYTIFSLWDTFRALHPLFTITQRERTLDFIESFLSMQEQSGSLPVWELAANETNCMIGYHSVSVITDAYFSGITNFDTSRALKAMIVSANDNEEKKTFHSTGYLPAENFSESVSKTLEFAYDDWCIAMFAKAIGDNKVYEEYIQYAQYWKNIFDPTTKFFRPRRNGGFPEPFDPFQVNFNFTEANAWQYRLFVPHDIETLMAYHGGKAAFQDALNDMLRASAQTTGREQADITGLIGQYAHGNEPSHHMAMLFNYTYDNTIQSRALVQRIMRDMYSNTPDGLCGNEDCGQMSAWYVLNAHGIYKTTPGQPEWTSLRDAKSSNDHTIAIPSLSIAPKSAITEHLIVPMPIIKGPQSSFVDEALIQIKHIDKNATFEVFFESDLGDKIVITTPDQFIITSSGIVTVIAIVNGKKSLPAQARFVVRDTNRTMELLTKCDAQYTGSTEDALIDGIMGGKDFRTGAWQGFNEQRLEAIVNLGEAKEIRYVAINCLREIKAWIWFPTEVKFYGSTDGKNFQEILTVKENDLTNEIVDVKNLGGNVKGSYQFIKVVATTFDTIPSWHLGAGGKPWIFADEIILTTKDE